MYRSAVAAVVDVAKWVETAVGLRPGVGQGADDERRGLVIDAAIAAIEEHGTSAGMAQIAERAGLQRPNVYRLFASKDNLDAAVVIVASTDLVTQVYASLDRVGTAAEIVGGVIDASVAWAEQHPNLYRFISAQDGVETLAVNQLGRERLLRDFAGAIRQYVGPVIDEETPVGVVAGVVGMVEASIGWWLDHRDESQELLVARLTRQVTLVLIDMLAQRGVVIAPDEVLTPAGDPLRENA